MRWITASSRDGWLMTVDSMKAPSARSLSIAASASRRTAYQIGSTDSSCAPKAYFFFCCGMMASVSVSIVVER
jgi:hypothetical protein